MRTTHHVHVPATHGSLGPSRPVKVALLTVTFFGGLYLLREHWGHVAGNWVYLLLLACPLMHFFHGHGGHAGRGGHGGHGSQSGQPAGKEG